MKPVTIVEPTFISHPVSGQKPRAIGLLDRW